ncbi:hypothetical protein PCANB_000748 [Pneumocystis canis]|nr:hypothetical protein PCANB_000748 [Pneumocystis canis]
MYNITRQTEFVKSESYKSYIEFSIPLNITLDGGFLMTHNLYQISQNYKYLIIHQLMFEGRMAPFYRGLSEFDSSWSNKKLIQVVRQHLLIPYKNTISLYTKNFPGGFYLKYISDILKSNKCKSFPPYTFRFRSIILLFRHLALIYKSFNPLPEVSLYRNAKQCLICFLYYPKVNYSRCCIQPVCSECFIKISGADLSTQPGLDNKLKNTSLVDGSVNCPFCFEKDFGIVYFFSIQKYNLEPSIISSIISKGSMCNIFQRYNPSHSSVVTSNMIRPKSLSQLINVQQKIVQNVANSILLNILMTSNDIYQILNLTRNNSHEQSHLGESEQCNTISPAKSNNYEQTVLNTTENSLSTNIVRLNFKDATYINYVTAIREKELATGEGLNRPIIMLYDGTTISLAGLLRDKNALNSIIVSNSL